MFDAVKGKLYDLVGNHKLLKKLLIALHIRDTRENSKEFRTLYVNNVKPDDYTGKEKPLGYAPNSIVTSKYTIFNFLPKNLYEQFRRLANFYFLLNIILMFVIPNPPTNPYVGALPLLFVVTITALKQGYEDILRHRADLQTNNTPVRILRNGTFKKLKWKDIQVGDIVEVTPDQQFPADLLLLHAHTDNQLCQITTANLDGETNLKTRKVPNHIPHYSTAEQLSNFRAVIQCDKPNLRLYEFKGKIIIGGQEYPITNENILLRGSCLKITPYIYGCAVYTGPDTKMMKNSKFKSNKLSCIEKKMNHFNIFYLIVLAILTFTSFAASSIFYADFYLQHWYLNGSEPEFYYTNRSFYNFLNIVLNLTQYQAIVPIALYVTIELQRFTGSKYIEYDLEMYDPVTEQPAKANTSDLNEDLGQIEFLFSDKTGTLTENEMEFKQFSIDGKTYFEKNGTIVNVDTNEVVDIMHDQNILMFLELLSICHTVQINEFGKEKYNASSPDEFSFVKFCLKLGIIYEGEDKDPLTNTMIKKVDFMGEARRYEVLHILEFDSSRKRMSIIFKDLQKNKIRIFCKGADTAIFKNCSESSSNNISRCNADIKRFSEQGWRTLALSYKELTPEQCSEIDQTLGDAYNDIVNREEKLDHAYEMIETNLELIGATAVEDKLQEDVANTLESLRRAGIKIWVLTGDKKETAINISHSCKHFSNGMVKLIITEVSKAEDVKKRLHFFGKQIKNQNKESFALVIDGVTLACVFSANLKNQFVDICLDCDAVLCCRMTPAQKAEIVKLVKHSRNKPMTAAIGDGANDVSMIQEANVGLGIYGKEGRNAAISADFAFAKFKHVRRILLVHGYLYYTRSAILVQYFFYKSVIYVCPVFLYAFSNAFSVTNLYDPVAATFFNLAFTGLPILLYGLFEQRHCIDEIQDNNFLYRTIAKNRMLTARLFVVWNFQALWHSLVSYFFSFALFQATTSFWYDGKISGSYEFGACVFLCIFNAAQIKLLTEWNYLSIFPFLSFCFVYLLFVFLLVLPSSFLAFSPITFFTEYQNLYWLHLDLFSKPTTWFTLALVLVTAFAPDFILKVFENNRLREKMAKMKVEEAARIRKFNKELEENFNYAFRSINVYYVSHPKNKDTNTKVYSGKLNYNDGTIDIESKNDKPNERIFSRLLNSRNNKSRDLQGSRTRSLSNRLFSNINLFSDRETNINNNSEQPTSSGTTYNHQQSNKSAV